MIRVGCSGWDYPDWEGYLYRPRENRFRAYAKVFDTVEVNSTFYRIPASAVVEGWARKSPEGFLFAAKVPSAATHEARLDKGAGRVISSFWRVMEPLRRSGKLGPLLLQLGPGLRYDPSVWAVLGSLPPGRFVLEFRHPSWLAPEVPERLRELGIGLCVFDGPHMPCPAQATSGVGYVRAHGRGESPWYDYRYDAGQVDALAATVRTVDGKARAMAAVEGMDAETVVYFNNHFHGYAPENALQLLDRLGRLTDEQAEALARIERRRAGAGPEEATLEMF